VTRKYRQAARLFVILALSACSESRSIPPGTDSYYEGNILTGSKFGLTVGSSVVPANGSGWTYSETAQCDSSLHQLAGCAPGDRFMIFLVEQRFRRGLVFVKVAHKRIEEIIWQTSLVQIET
jgi:hypothetical protein